MKVENVKIIYEDKNGHRREIEYEVGESAILGTDLHARWTVKEIEAEQDFNPSRRS